MNGNVPPEGQKLWREAVRNLGSIISARGPVEIHHPIGRTAQVKIDYVSTNIGHWYVLPLTKAEHKMIDTNKKGFESKYGSEKQLFKSVCRFYQTFYGEELPFSDEIYQAIQDYHK